MVAASSIITYRVQSAGHSVSPDPLLRYRLGLRVANSLVAYLQSMAFVDLCTSASGDLLSVGDDLSRRKDFHSHGHRKCRGTYCWWRSLPSRFSASPANNPPVLIGWLWFLGTLVPGHQLGASWQPGVCGSIHVHSARSAFWWRSAVPDLVVLDGKLEAAAWGCHRPGCASKSSQSSRGVMAANRHLAEFHHGDAARGRRRSKQFRCLGYRSLGEAYRHARRPQYERPRSFIPSKTLQIRPDDALAAAQQSRCAGGRRGMMIRLALRSLSLSVDCFRPQVVRTGEAYNNYGNILERIGKHRSTMRDRCLPQEGIKRDPRISPQIRHNLALDTGQKMESSMRRSICGIRHCGSIRIMPTLMKAWAKRHLMLCVTTCSKACVRNCTRRSASIRTGSEQLKEPGGGFTGDPSKSALSGMAP